MIHFALAAALVNWIGSWGGIVPGSLILLGGDPGIGKSTLLLQVADAIARDGKRVLYVSGEESLKQLKMRSLRLGITAAQNIYLSADQDIDALENLLLDIAPEVVIIDSIQTVFLPIFLPYRAV